MYVCVLERPNRAEREREKNRVIFSWAILSLQWISWQNSCVVLKAFPINARCDPFRFHIVVVAVFHIYSIFGSLSRPFFISASVALLSVLPRLFGRSKAVIVVIVAVSSLLFYLIRIWSLIVRFSFFSLFLMLILFVLCFLFDIFLFSAPQLTYRYSFDRALYHHNTLLHAPSFGLFEFWSSTVRLTYRTTFVWCLLAVTHNRNAITQPFVSLLLA